ncbi:hypothetical protein DE146DRAFT_636929 [Phaeosphaeria sp. MPI-PUGE-AT-0046c]|nr:hypothetical protein DE146DRAFT_636929 [Phaeosphaeria sp. MPI-PUGE-AT-0046c]
MRKFGITRKPAVRLLRNCGNDINRALQSRSDITSTPKANADDQAALTATKSHREQDAAPADTSDGAGNNAPAHSSAQAAPPERNVELAEFFKGLSIIAPALAALDRKLAASALEPHPRARKKMSFYAYSLAHLPRSLSVLPRRSCKPACVSKSAELKQVSPLRSRKLPEPMEKYPYTIVQHYLAREPPTSAQVMGCSSRDDAQACLAGYEESFQGRSVFVKGRGKQFCVPAELGNGEWGFEVRILDRKVCKVNVTGNEQEKDV